MLENYKFFGYVLQERLEISMMQCDSPPQGLGDGTVVQTLENIKFIVY